jgi:hemolysin D
MSGVFQRVAALWGGDEASRNRREFLPAALEVIETPASPTGRAMALAIGAFFTLAVVWACFGKVDIITTAPGRLTPIGRTKLIQPLDAGVVRAIHVQDGDHVRAGQVLIELDPTAAGADQDSLTHDLALAELDVARLNALKQAAETGGAAANLVMPAGASADDKAQVEAALRSQIATQAAKISALDEQIAQHRAEEQEIASTIDKVNASLPLLRQKQRLNQDLRNQGYGTSFAALDAQQALSDAERDLPVEMAKGQQAHAAAASLESQRAQAVAEYHEGILADLAKAEEKDNELTQNLVKARQKSAATQLVAPADGVAEDLAIHTVGGVVTPAQQLLVIVPDGVGLDVEAQLANRDVGFVHPGQDVSIKVETFDFTHYGLVHGKVIAISRDTVTPPPPGASAAGPADGAPATNPNQPPGYVARIALNRADMDIDGRREPLTPGMAVTAEIKTGRRTIINYLLSPLVRRTSEAMHER